MKKEYNLDERLLQFSLRAIEVVEALPDTKTCNHLGGQLLRSGTSVALNFSEGQASESDRDLIHKFKIVLKELRECFMALRMLRAKSLLKDVELTSESDELIRIFVASIKTINKRMKDSR